jgi:deoxyribodipyrimidine photo-lyase
VIPRGPSTSVLWLRRDLRAADHPALAEAATKGAVLPVWVLDPKVWKRAGLARRAWLAASLRALPFADRLVVRLGDPARVLPDLAAEVYAGSVHVSAETTPYGARRDERVRQALERVGVDWVATGSPYAVSPGRVLTGEGTGFKVFTPFARAWREHGWWAPAQSWPPESGAVSWASAASDDKALALLDQALSDNEVELPPAGEEAALAAWEDFLADGLDDYDERRDRPDLAGTSRLSPYLSVGAIHPRTLLADLASVGSSGAERFATELAWREFYADVLHREPSSAWADLRDLGLSYEDPGPLFDAWRAGRTGFPIVDAGMRQLAATGWMHNRVRMIVASFLTKDLHVWWPHGARHFMESLVDFDLASNSHGWQWVAGTGTDAAPYFRVFNPTLQGQRYDPSGDYVRRWVPELAGLAGAAAHEPWRHGGAPGYPDPVVDHAVERKEALRRWEERG